MRISSVVAAAALVVSLTGCKSKSEQYCRQALTEVTQMAASMSARFGGAGGAAPTIPEEPFMSQCKQLPEGAAHCAVLSYAMAHQPECQQFASQLQGLRQHH